MTITNSSLPDVSLQDLMDAGLHFGHQTKRWNPKMAKFIYGERNGIYIIDLVKTLNQLKIAQKFIYDTVAHGRQVLFVGTKKQAQIPVKETADRFNQPYVINRWLGGMLTNNTTLQGSIRRLKQHEAMEADGRMDKLSKKESSALRREYDKSNKNLAGVARMERLPAALMVIDVMREKIAVAEANRLGIPVIALVDTNGDPDGINYPIPGNDDGSRAIELIIKLLGDTILLASNEYAKHAAEESRKRAIAEAEDANRRKVAEAERRSRTDDERKKRDSAIKDRKPRAPKAEATPAPAPEAKAEETKPAADAPQA